MKFHLEIKYGFSINLFCPNVYPKLVQLQSYIRQGMLYFKGHHGLYILAKVRNGQVSSGQRARLLFDDSSANPDEANLLFFLKISFKRQ